MNSSFSQTNKLTSKHQDSLSLFEQMLIIEKNLSPNTVQAYMRDLIQFFSLECSPEEFLVHLEQTSTIASIKRKFSALKQFCKFINIKLDISLPKTQTQLKLIDPQQLINIINNTTNLRDKTFLHILLATGCRVSECLKLTNNQIRECLINDQLYFTILGKGNKERTIFLTNKVLELIHEYRKKYNTKTWVFENKNKPLTRQWAHKIIKQLGVKLNIENVHPHSFRHGQALLLLESGVDLISIQKILGHSDLKSTQIYLNLHFDQLEQELVKHPLQRSNSS